MHCFSFAAGTDSGHKNNPPVTITANEAYGMHSLPVSMDHNPLSSAAPVYERVDNECVK